MDLLAADRGRTAIDHYSAEGHASDDPPTSLADLIADMLIWAALEGIDWEHALERAQDYALSGEPCPRCSSEVPSASLNCPACAAGAPEPR